MFVICVSQWSATRLDVFGAESWAPDWRTTMFFVLVILWRRARAWFWVQSTLTLGKCCALVSHHFPGGVKYLWRGDWKRQILEKSADIYCKVRICVDLLCKPLSFRFWIWLESVTCRCSELHKRERSTSGPVWHYISVLCFVFEDWLKLQDRYLLHSILLFGRNSYLKYPN